MYRVSEYRLEEKVEEKSCGICIGKMRLAVKLHCGHEFHKFCVMQMIANGKTRCPICKMQMQRHYASNIRREQEEWGRNGNIIGRIVRSVIMIIIRNYGEEVRREGEAGND